MRVRNMALILLLSLAVTILTGCAGGAPAPTPTPSKLEPTATPVSPKPTPTPLPPTPTPPPPTATPVPSKALDALWTDAMAKVKSATKYRMAMTLIVGATEKGQFQEKPLMVVEGYVVNQDSYMVFTGGMMNELMGGAKIEMINAGGKTYIKGIGMFGDTNKWYIMPAAAQAGPTIMPEDMLDMTGQDVQALREGAKMTGKETLDGQACDVWSWDMKAAYQGFLGLVTDPEAKGALDALDKAESRSWLCADGYVHQVQVEIAGHDKDNPANKGSVKIKAHLWDFNNPGLSVKAPEGAVPFGP